MAAEQKIKSLKITGRNKVPLFPANWVAGVDYDGDDPYGDKEEPEPDDEYDYEMDQPMDDNFDDDDYDRIDQAEIDEPTAEPGQGQQQTQPDPIDIEQPNNVKAKAPEAEAPVVETVEPETVDDEPIETVDDEPEAAVDESSDESEDEQPQRPRRTVKPIDRLSPNFAQATKEKKKVQFEDDDLHLIEMCHNLIAQVSPNPKSDVEYDPALATVIA